MTFDLEYTLIAAAVAGCVVFCIAYPAVTDPRRWTREGFHMWALTLALATLGGFSIGRRLLGEWPGYDVMVSITYATIAALLWQRVLLLYQARREVRHGPAPAREADPRRTPR